MSTIEVDQQTNLLQVAVLSIGDELCIGQVINSNAAWIAEQCSILGAHVSEHRVVPDSPEVMLQALRELAATHDVILMTGGLGPTHDDITKAVLCQYFDDELIVDAKTLQELELLFEQRKRVLTDRNRAQALVPSKATAWSNARGSAPGLSFLHNQVLYVAMPGVPQEMKAIMQDHILALIEQTLRAGSYHIMRYKTYTASGIAESSLADLLGDPEHFLGGHQLAFLPSYSAVRLRLSVSAASIDEADKIIETIGSYIKQTVGKYIVAEDKASLNSTLHDALVQSGKTLALAESCTGGMLGMLFTDNSGSSAYFLGGIQCYSNQSKHRELGVAESMLDHYGAVSQQVVEALAVGARNRFESDYSLAISGIAGPEGGTSDKPVGTIWIALASEKGVVSQLHHFGSDRNANRERACAAAQLLLLEQLRSL